METPMSEQMMKITRTTLSASWRMNWKWRSTWSRSCRMRRTRWEKDTNCPCFSISEKGWWPSSAHGHLTSPGLWAVISSGLPEQSRAKNCCHPYTDTHASSLCACPRRPHCLRHTAVVHTGTREPGNNGYRPASELVLCPCLPSHLELVPHCPRCWLVVSRRPAIFFFFFFIFLQ